jgi:integrase/recombinase XerD
MKTSAHLYRHTFAKNWILNGGDIFRLQKVLGHSDLTVVKEYVNMFSNDLSIDFDRFNPLDRLEMNQMKKHIKM